MTIRVLQVLGRSAGGIGRHVATLVDGLDGPDLLIEVAAPTDLGVEMPKATIPVDIPKSAGLGLLAAGSALRRTLAGGKWDVVHAHGLRAGLVTLRAADESVPVIVTLHNLIRPEISGRMRSLLYRRGETSIVHRAQKVFAVSAEMESVLRSRAPAHAHKVDLLPIGLPQPEAKRSASAVRSELGVSNGTPLVLTVARLVPQKALHVLLEALARTREPVLVVAGEGRLRPDLEQRARSLEVSDRVRFLGARSDVGDLLAAADVFALSSTWEARALAAQEAILARVPVVSTDVGGMPELVEDNVSGRLVPANDPQALAEAIEDVLKDPEKARAFAARARDALTSSYSAADMLGRVRAEYVRLARV